MNHLRKKKHTILIFFSIVFDNLSVLILSDFFKYFWSQFHFSKSQIGSNSVWKWVLKAYWIFIIQIIARCECPPEISWNFLRKKEDKKVSGECLSDSRILRRSCSPVHLSHLSPVPKRNKLNYWLWLLFITERQGTLADVIYLFPYFSHLINAFKWKTGDFFD